MDHIDPHMNNYMYNFDQRIWRINCPDRIGKDDKGTAEEEIFHQSAQMSKKLYENVT